jgi:hypothetical protein
LPVSTFNAEKLPVLEVDAVSLAEAERHRSRRMRRRPAMPGDLLEGRRAVVTPQVMNVLFSGLYELAGQSIISNGCTTYSVVSYGSYAHPILNGLPSGAVAVANGW